MIALYVVASIIGYLAIGFVVSAIYRAKDWNFLVGLDTFSFSTNTLVGILFLWPILFVMWTIAGIGFGLYISCLVIYWCIKHAAYLWPNHIVQGRNPHLWLARKFNPGCK